jgi:tagaturonate reductase
MTQTPVLQFGTSRFLQAHADLFIAEARAQGQDAGPITIVQSSGDTSRTHRLEALTQPFPIRIEGQSGGETVKHTVMVDSVTRAISTAREWDAVAEVFVNEAEIILSNTGDAGYAAQPADDTPGFEQSKSYPGKLTDLLRLRFAAGAAPLQIMPLELIVNNGAVLKQRVLELAQTDDTAFREYLETDVIWVNSLVDRIVSEPLEPAGAVAEPYALWAIEAQPGLRLPCDHPSVQVVDDLGKIEALKLFVLNLGHSFFADSWINEGGDDSVLVRDLMAAPGALTTVLQDEVRPAFVAAGWADEFDSYVATTMDRFANPFLAHRISDIAQNHSQKVDRRIGGFLAFAHEHGDASEKPILQNIVQNTAQNNAEKQP